MVVAFINPDGRHRICVIARLLEARAGIGIVTRAVQNRTPPSSTSGFIGDTIVAALAHFPVATIEGLVV
ncbi:MAG: hypothetical protein ACT6WE_08335 [Shinella sp.]|uniref:hypothetical protein n=1 Tax=Shinella sp. TaxID=1870904 RepID=UPI00403521CA